MHNGCLLLLAFVAVFQPIASYTERGLVDGRQQRCDYRRTSIHDPGLNLHGTYRFAKPAVEDRRLSQREDIRDVRRNEVREDFLRTASSSDRQLGDPLERIRNTLKGPSRDHIGNDAVLRREVRDARLSSYRDEHNQEIRPERVARVQETHPARSPSRRENSRSEYENRYQTDNRLSNEHRDSELSRRDTRANEAAAQRVRENREIRAAINRVRDDVAGRLNERRLTREGVQRMDSQRSAYRIQLDGNADRENLVRRSRNIERINRAYNREDSRMASRDETASFDRDDRRMSSSRRSADERRQLHDVSRIRFRTERRNIPESGSRMNVRNLHEHASEMRREARSFERARSTESRRENRDIESRLIRTVRSVDDRVSQDDDTSYRRFARERSAENQRDLRGDRSMAWVRSLERSTEYRKDSRSSDRAEDLENQREFRNIETRRDIRNIQKDSSEVRGETRNRDTCANDRERFAEHRMARLARGRSQENRRVARNVEFRSISTESVDESRRGNDHRSFRTERTDQSRQDNRNLESRAFRIEQTQRYSNNVESRLFRTERADESRQAAASTAGIRSFRTEQNSQQNGFRAFGSIRAADSRRNTQAFERLSGSLDRDNDYRRDSRSRLHERTLENRRSIRDTDLRIENERVANRRAARSLERESITNGRRMESGLNGIMVAGNSRTFMLERLSEDRRERATDNRRKAQNTPKKLRTLHTHEGRRVRSRGINLVRSRNDLIQRRTERAIERLSKRDSLENRYEYTLQQESLWDTQRTTERDSLATRLRETEARNGINANFARKREFQAMFKHPTHAENETPTRNWQYLFYTVQALYIGGLLMQLNKRSVDKKTRLSWWSAPQHLTKVE